MIIDILTGFPELFSGPANSSILRNALLSDACEIWVHDLRHYTTERHGKIDDAPYGGGAGMILMAQPVFACLDRLMEIREGYPARVFLSPQGATLKQETVRDLTSVEWLILLCGHYKDVDARVFERDRWREISIGDYVLSGGELAAAVLLDSIVRLLPGVLGDDESSASDSFEDGLLDAPYYTKPDLIENLKVPDVLLSGHHERIAKWRRDQRETRTRDRRPDLWDRHQLSDENK